MSPCLGELRLLNLIGSSSLGQRSGGALLKRYGEGGVVARLSRLEKAFKACGTVVAWATDPLALPANAVVELKDGLIVSKIVVARRIRRMARVARLCTILSSSSSEDFVSTLSEAI